MEVLKICSKGFRRRPRHAEDSGAGQEQLLHPRIALSSPTPSLLPAHPAHRSPRSTSRKKGYGLELLYDGRLHYKGQNGNAVDIVAIHGLNGNAYSTWRHSNGTLWLKDILPNDLPNSRIFTYGYPAEVFFSKSVEDILDYSRRFLNELWGELIEASPDNATRPIIFVCHSLGGLVCKQALLLANESKNHYQDILSATAAVVFLGTPHRGSKIADTAKAVSDIANVFFRITQITNFTRPIRSDLVSALKADAGKLQALATSFQEQLDYLPIVTFYERQWTPPLGDLVVDRESAIMGIAREQVIPLNANHRTMCQFDTSSNREYLSVLNEIRRLARDAKTNRHSANLSLMSSEKRCMSLLYSTNLADYKTQLPRPVQGTCSWIHENPKYASWIKSEETGLLWVTGEPGCGKTMLSVYLTEHLEPDATDYAGSQVFYFFCDDKITTQRDAKDILRSILHQILQQHRRLIKYARSRWEATGHNLVESFATLWEIFRKIVSEARLGPVVVIVDAIDECESDTRRTFLQSIKQFVQDSRKLAQRPRTVVKFLFTSRPSLKELSTFEELEKSVISIDENPTRISGDVKLVIKDKFHGIAKKAGFSEDTRMELEELLYSKAEKSFLWLNIVLETLENTPSTSKKDFRRIINDFPRKLEATYERFLHLIPQESRGYGRDILCLLIGSSRHLTLEEMNIAYTICQDIYKTLGEVKEARQHAIESMLKDIVGPFIRIEASKISLIHQSVKDFLSEFALHSTDVAIRGFGYSSSTTALAMATTSIRYLLLEDFATDIFVRAQHDLGKEDIDDDLVTGSFPLDFYSGLDALLGISDDIYEICSSIAQEYPFFDYASMHWAKHFSACESIAPEHISRAVRQLTDAGSCFLNNWLKYFWAKSDMEFAIPDDFDVIIVAAFFGFSMLLEECLQEATAPVSQSKRDRALFWAARTGCANAAKVLLRHGANPNAQALYQHTPLTIASHHGQLETVKVLLSDTRCNVNAKGKSGRSALSFAAGNGHLEVFELLFRHKDSRPEEPDENGWIPLFWAIERDHTTIAHALLRHSNVDINHIDRSGRTVVSWAAGEGFAQALQMLLAQPNVDVNIRDSKGRSPLLWAAANGHENIIDVLMQGDNGVKRLSKDNDQRSALSLACAGGHTDAVKALLKYRCGVEDEGDVDGWTPLAWALDRQSPQTVEVLLSGRGIQLDRKDSNGRTVLVWAASYGYTDVVKMLLDQGADPRIGDSQGQTALDVSRALAEADFDRGDIIQLLEAALRKANGAVSSA